MVISKRFRLTVAILTLLVANSAVLAESRFGVESAFYNLIPDSYQYSLGLNYFTEDYEIALPIGITNYETPLEAEKKSKFVDVSLVYRNFLDNSKGRSWKPYYGVFLRYAHLEGTPYRLSQSEATSMDKFGFGVNIGFRKFITYKNKERFYWGGGIFVGKYVSGQHEIFEHNRHGENVDLTADLKAILDAELLKVGIVF